MRKGVLPVAYIEKRGEASWRLVVDVGRDANGKRKTKRKTIRVQDPALLRTTKRLQDHLELELRKFQIEVEAGQYVAPSRVYFDEFVKTWLDRHVDVELSDKTQINYRYHINKRIVPHFGGMRLDQIRPMHINDFLEKLRTEDRIGSSTIMYIYRVLRSIFKYATQWQVLAENPIAGVAKPKEKERGEIQVYDEADLDALFTALDDEPAKHRCIVLLAVTGGLRRGEIAGLEWRHIDLYQRTVEITQSIPMYKDGEPVIKRPKTRKSIRKIAIPVLLVDQLLEYQQVWQREREYAKEKWGGPGQFLFCHESGKPHDPHWITDMWIDFRKRHNLKHIRFHDLRHTAATWMIKAGVHPKAIANRLGHVNIKTTMDVYGHIIESVDHAAASVFDDMPTGGMKRGALVGSKLGAGLSNGAIEGPTGQN